MKKNILSIIVVNLFVLGALLGMINNSKVVNHQFDYLNDNQIRIFNPTGFTTEQMEQISNQSGISEVVFDNQNIFPMYQIETENGALGVQGISIEENNQYQTELNYLAGGPLTEIYQVIITQSLADKLIELGYGKDYDSLIGTDMVSGLQIVGVYPDSIDLHIDEDNQHIITYSQQAGQFVQVSDSNYQNSFMMFNRGRETDKYITINNYNLDAAWQYEEDTNDYDRYIYNTYDGELDEYQGIYYVNYEESVANGATGLIDPTSAAYGEDFNQYGFIETSGDRDQVVDELTKSYPDAVVVTNDTKFSDVDEQSGVFIKLMIAIIIFELFILVPLFKNYKAA